MEKGKVKVLAIDDEKLILDQLRYFLSESGFDVEATDDSKYAMKLLEERDFDIVLTDLVMPEITGMDIVKKVKDLGKDSLVIIITGFATTDSAIEAIKYGVYDYVRKPFNLKELLAILNRAAEKLFLQRENIALNRKIKEMLEVITTLYEISSILYQVDDLELAKSMIMDTLSEGIKAKKVALFLPRGEYFSIDGAIGLGERFCKVFRLREGEKIDGKIVGSDSIIVLEKVDKNTVIGEEKLDIDEKFGMSFIVPIKYMDMLYGFIGVFDIDTEGLFSVEDKMKLWNIVSTQIAPVFGRVVNKGRKDVRREGILENIIQEKVDSAREIGVTVSFLYVRVVPKDVPERGLRIRQLRSRLESLIRTKLTGEVEIVAQNFDSFLVMVSGGNPVELELKLEEIKGIVETGYISGETGAVTFVYGIATYPTDGLEAGEIIARLEDSVLHSMVLR